ncbi:MarR family transcriptional regulator [Virgibacillus sp. 179-BFC.A HS]|uniref:MarR family transcriptional regulator n=1 Tax=Tigheibacillus jepli TaxID=3035914 RepID=A0ABU5CK74_9BACI|nr:MarR family transcriptional regulator [Virgibacillus sp. 179-BFC.A HS]MDY0406331.1 MarR family transcriptional regulator [Virgibacillus sp. 179-BFC.A HS]
MELEEVVHRYQIAMNSVYRGINNIMKEHASPDITADQFPTLQYIAAHEKCTSTEIATTFGIGKSAVTAQITRLFEKGFIERNRDTKDRRTVYLHVTPSGLEIVKQTEQVILNALGPVLGHFSDEDIRYFLRLLEELAELMDVNGKGVQG